MANDNFDLSRPDPMNLAQLKAYSRKEGLDLLRKAKSESALAGLSDRGIDLTHDEERELREFSVRKGVSFDEVADFMAAAYIVLGDRGNSRICRHLTKHNAIERNRLAYVMKNLIYLRAVRRDSAMA